MIALTQEKREKRINWLKSRISSMEQCRDEMPFGLSEDESMELSAYKDSLSSLTAEPIEYLTWHQGCRAPDDCEEYAIVADKGDKSCDGSEAFPVFTAPPVPEIKLIEPADFIRKWNNSDDCPLAGLSAKSAANKAVSSYAQEIKRLNGLGE